MNSFYYDILLTLFTFGLMAFLAYRSMRSRKIDKSGDDEGGESIDINPKIDLPPGVIWPSDQPSIKVNETEEVLV